MKGMKICEKTVKKLTKLFHHCSRHTSFTLHVLPPPEMMKRSLMNTSRQKVSTCHYDYMVFTIDFARLSRSVDDERNDDALPVTSRPSSWRDERGMLRTSEDIARVAVTSEKNDASGHTQRAPTRTHALLRATPSQTCELFFVG